MSLNLTTAFCLLKSHHDYLSQGRNITGISASFMVGQSDFALCPIADSPDDAQVEYWAHYEGCTMFQNDADLERVGKITAWQLEELKLLRDRQYNLFIVNLRVYRLDQAIFISAKRLKQNVIGKFIQLPHPISATTKQPCLDEWTFKKRVIQFKNLEEPQHPELEALHAQLAKTAQDHPDASSLLQDLNAFLSWGCGKYFNTLDSNIAWISQISIVGNSSDGHAFEKLVRRSLLLLGFHNSEQISGASLNPDATGGAGGLDVYCESPFKLVGECKASKNKHIPTDVCSQLTYLSQKHLGNDIFLESVKIIFASSYLNADAEQISCGNQTNLMRAETLQNLIELKANYPGSINLLKLEKCLKSEPFGNQSDSKIQAFIDNIKQEILLRSDVVVSLRNHLNQPGIVNANIKNLSCSDLFNILIAQYPCHANQLHDLRNLYDILIELSSPLTGYLGRLPGENWRDDRFYYLRDLPVPNL
jgi:hypothetical protein